MQQRYNTVMRRAGISRLLAIVMLGIFELLGAHVVAAASVDLSGDGVVDSNDLAIIVAHYNQTPAGSVSYDLNGDHKVNSIDLSIEAKYWAKRCTGNKCKYP